VAAFCFSSRSLQNPETLSSSGLCLQLHPKCDGRKFRSAPDFRLQTSCWPRSSGSRDPHKYFRLWRTTRVQSTAAGRRKRRCQCDKAATAATPMYSVLSPEMPQSNRRQWDHTPGTRRAPERKPATPAWRYWVEFQSQHGRKAAENIEVIPFNHGSDSGRQNHSPNAVSTCAVDYCCSCLSRHNRGPLFFFARKVSSLENTPE
jgi:hypothetical protein